MDDIHEFNQQIIDEFRANDGVVGGPFDGVTLLLLHTVGAKSGTPRVHPIGYTRVGDELVVIASNAGAQHHPAWYHNIAANPNVTIEAGSETFRAVATITDEPRRTELFNHIAARLPVFADYQRQTSRRLPVIVLTPVA